MGHWLHQESNLNYTPLMNVKEWKLHFRRHPGVETAFEYKETMTLILNNLEMMNPEDLLLKDQYLLGVNLEDLAPSPADRRQVWQANLETAITAAEHVNRKTSRKTVNTQAFRRHTPNYIPTNKVYMRQDVDGTISRGRSYSWDRNTITSLIRST